MSAEWERGFAAGFAAGFKAGNPFAGLSLGPSPTATAPAGAVGQSASCGLCGQPHVGFPCPGMRGVVQQTPLQSSFNS